MKVVSARVYVLFSYLFCVWMQGLYVHLESFDGIDCNLLQFGYIASDSVAELPIFHPFIMQDRKSVV